MRIGGHIVADALRLNGADVVFCVPGESFLDILDGLVDHRDAIRLVTMRHEASAANAAEAYGKLTGRPGVVMVTRGPGASQAVVGVHTARQDSTPMILIVGQVNSPQRGREAFQEIDYGELFGGRSIAKWVAEASAPDELPGLVEEAYARAVSGRPGPVVLSLPEDVLRAQSAAPDAPPGRRSVPAPGDLAPLRAMLEAAERPLVLLGGSDWTAAACGQLRAWCEASGLAVAAGFRCQDLVPNGSPCYVGHVGLATDPRLQARVREADLIVAVGERLGGATTHGYTLLDPARMTARLVHVQGDPAELGRVYTPDLAIASGMPEFTAALAVLPPVDGRRWSAWRDAARAEYLADLEPPAPSGRGVDLANALAHVRAALPPDAIVCSGAGNYTFFCHRYLTFERFRSQLAPTSGAMGYGFPAAIAAKLVHPERPVVCVAGDGCFQMALPELATAVAERLPMVILLADNGMLGSIRMHQERRYPGRISGTLLANPDFAALAESYGAQAETVEDDAGFAAALERALRADRPAVVWMKTDPDAVSARQRLSEMAEDPI
jgi:acetolactate synthase-1/2/3 large subunit